MPRTASVPADDGLFTLDLRQPVSAYLRSMWRRRDFAVALARSDLRGRHMNTFFGQAWYLVNPAMSIAVYFMIFGLILSARRGIEDYVSFLVVGVMFVRFTQSAITNCAGSLAKNAGLIRSIQFPRILVPISVIIESVLQFVPSLVLVAVVVTIDGDGPILNWLAIPVVLAVATGLSTGLGLIMARIGAILSDVQQILPHVFRIMFYFSGVLFSVEDRISNETLRSLFVLNPFFNVIELARWSLLGRSVATATVIAMAIWTGVSLLIGFVVFKRAEHRYGA
jgi:teichoic acid transport system permease protein